MVMLQWSTEHREQLTGGGLDTDAGGGGDATLGGGGEEAAYKQPAAEAAPRQHNTAAQSNSGPSLYRQTKQLILQQQSIVVVGVLVDLQVLVVGEVVGLRISVVGLVVGSQVSVVGLVVGSQVSVVGLVAGSQVSVVGLVAGSQVSVVGLQGVAACWQVEVCSREVVMTQAVAMAAWPAVQHNLSTCLPAQRCCTRDQLSYKGRPGHQGKEAQFFLTS